MQRLGPGYRGDVSNDDDGETSATCRDGGVSPLPFTPDVEASQPVSSEAATKGWRASNSKGYNGVRRKRYSLPSIRLYSSLDSPGACYSGPPSVPNHLVAKLQQSPLAIVQNDQSAAGNSNDQDESSTLANKLVRGHASLALRRSRELTRADTEVLPPFPMDDESGY